MSIPEDCWFCHGNQKVKAVCCEKCDADEDSRPPIVVDCPVCKGVGELIAV